MARKPKASKINEFAVSPEQVLAVLSDAPTPVRRGRKPKAAAPPEPLATMDSDDAAGSTADADASIAAPAAAPMRKRPGPKPKQRAGAAEAAPSRDKPGRGALAPEIIPEPMSATARKPGAGLPGQQDRKEQVQGNKPVPLQATPGAAASGAARSDSSRNAAASTQPAAHWDRATDAVRFDWAEINRTASQDGPNQVMAKLLVAACAEGANSRWPF
ncbi:MAG: hypothetical protein ACRYHQ_28810 [Janthinobacterium lividum]